MTKVTYDMLGDFSPAVQTAYHLLYPHGLTMEQLEQKAKDFTWLRIIYKRFKEDDNGND